jgi:hypothetical protein
MARKKVWAFLDAHGDLAFGARDFTFMQWVKQQRCLMRAEGDCAGAIEAHHAGPHAMSRKAPDWTCVPLCGRHHRDYHELTGPFRPGGKAARRRWASAAIIETVMRHARWSAAMAEAVF